MKKETAKVEQREVRDGKPYFGIWFGRSIIMNRFISDPWNEDSAVKNLIMLLKSSIPKKLEFREESIIYRPALVHEMNVQNPTIAIKGILWGRAFEVMRFFAKGNKIRFKKVYRCGKRKRIKI